VHVTCSSSKLPAAATGFKIKNVHWFEVETKLLSRIKILLTRGIHNCGTFDFQDSSHLGCDAVSFGEQFLTLSTTIMPSPPGTA
jgi:hypothetical protein